MNKIRRYPLSIMTVSRSLCMAYFISPHGFGHAARAAAVIGALQELHPAFRFEIFTTVPYWFFEDSLACHLGYHSLGTDVGLGQKTPLGLTLLDQWQPAPKEGWSLSVKMALEGLNRIKRNPGCKVGCKAPKFDK